MICDGVLEAVGRTPLVRLRHVLPDTSLRIFAKLEALNPGGSVKDRSAVEIIKSALDSGEIRPDTTVIESSSGNMAIGLAQACAYYKLKLICVVDAKTTPQHLNLLSAYGAHVDVVAEADPATGEFLVARLNRVRSLLKDHKNSFWPNQYSNPNNAMAQRGTMQEIHEALGDRIDYVFCATSTCGTIHGCSDYIERSGLTTKLVAVDALGSVIFGSPARKRLIPGHGASLRPALCDGVKIDKVAHVSDLDCVVGCRRLVEAEGILAGGSGGGVIRALEETADSIPAGAVCVVILADRGERYLDTVYSDQWVRSHFGEVSHLWKGQAYEQSRRSSAAGR